MRGVLYVLALFLVVGIVACVLLVQEIVASIKAWRVVREVRRRAREASEELASQRGEL